MTVRAAYRKAGRAGDLVRPGATLDPAFVFARLAADASFSGTGDGNLDTALRRLVTGGFTTEDGEKVLGVRDLLARITQQRLLPAAAGSPWPRGTKWDDASLGTLEVLLRSPDVLPALAAADLDNARQLVGADGARSIALLAQIPGALVATGSVVARDGGYVLTPRGLRRMARGALRAIVSSPQRTPHGAAVPDGSAHDRTGETKPYVPGDPLEIDAVRTVFNSIRRHGSGGAPRLLLEDFEIACTEPLPRTATVLAVDVSLSMPERGFFLAAKQVALALYALGATRSPMGALSIVAFADTAREIGVGDLAGLSWEHSVGTNIAAALSWGRRTLTSFDGTRRILLITDGEPTARTGADGGVDFCSPPSRSTIEATLAEARRCRRAGIEITTFLLGPRQQPGQFVERMAALNRGRVVYATPETLGGTVLVDYLAGGRKLRRLA